MNRLPLAQLPTPMSFIPPESLAALLADGAAEAWSGDAQALPRLWIKRDDCTGFLFSGNKVRKLEYVLAHALHVGATHVLTCGGWQSNHCRATAAACRQRGLEPVLLLRVEDAAAEPPLVGNYLLDRLFGAHIHRLTAAQYAERDAWIAEAAERLAGQGHVPYVVPEGASNGLGALGYVDAVAEIGEQLAAAELPPLSTLVVAVGSGGTVAGLQLGADRHPGVIERLLGVCVCDDAAFFRLQAIEIRRDAATWLTYPPANTAGDAAADEATSATRRLRAHDGATTPTEFDDAHIGDGYGRPYPAMMRDLAALARRHGIVLDPTYTGKAWHAMLQRLRNDPTALGERVCFLHTGGVFGLFAHAATGDAVASALPVA